MSDVSTTRPLSAVPYETRFADTLAAIQQALEGYLTPPTPHPIAGPEGLWEAMRYSVLDGGKRIRPVFAMETCRACGGDLETILPTACAIELVHAQSLIHDDLPCMDNDDLRRGKPTVHRAFNESTAVLAGDALLALAFGLVARHTPLDSPDAAARLVAVLGDFAQVASVEGLVNGQFVDILYEGQPYTGEVLEYIHTYKTSALFRFAARAGAHLAGASPPVVEVFSQVGQRLGLAFQIVDDLLDIEANAETLGKTPGKDRQQEKATYPAFFGVEPSRQKAAQLVAEALQLLDDVAPLVPGDLAPLQALAAFIQVRIH